MEKFILIGKTRDGLLKQLRVPNKKIIGEINTKNKNISQYQDVKEKNNSDEVPASIRSELLQLSTPGQMFSSHIIVNEKLTDQMNSRHGYPLSQGPVVPQIDKVI